MKVYFLNSKVYFVTMLSDTLLALEVSKKFLQMHLRNKELFLLSWLLKKATYHEIIIKKK